MTTELSNNKLLTDTATCFKMARKGIYEGTRLLYQVRETNAWEGAFSSFSEYVEQECQISRSGASKLLQVWEYYVLEGRVSQLNLEGVDSEKLYMALKLPTGTAEEKLLKAREWNREDLRAELYTTGGNDCEHPSENRVTICGQCSKRVV